MVGPDCLLARVTGQPRIHSTTAAQQHSRPGDALHRGRPSPGLRGDRRGHVHSSARPTRTAARNLAVHWQRYRAGVVAIVAVGTAVACVGGLASLLRVPAGCDGLADPGVPPTAKRSVATCRLEGRSTTPTCLHRFSGPSCSATTTVRRDSSHPSSRRGNGTTSTGERPGHVLTCSTQRVGYGQ